MSLGSFLRRKRVLLAIFTLSLTYFIIATYSQFKSPVIEEDDIISPVNIEEILKTIKPASHDVMPADDGSHYTEKAQQLDAHGNGAHQGNEATQTRITQSGVQAILSNYTCKNSVQGRSFIADENGYICDRFDLKPNGCCNLKASSTKRYSCDACSEAGCCSMFEQCVSCCLHPQKQHHLRNILEKTANNINRVYSLINTHFELCLTKCRTSSESVRHENSYIDSSLKYCYGSNTIEDNLFDKDKPNRVRRHIISR